MPRSKGSTKFQRAWFRAVREGRVKDATDARTRRYCSMIENGERLIGQEAIAEYLDVSPETLRRWLRTWPELRRFIYQDPATRVYSATIGELMNFSADIYERRSKGQRKRVMVARRLGGQFSS